LFITFSFNCFSYWSYSSNIFSCWSRELVYLLVYDWFYLVICLKLLRTVEVFSIVVFWIFNVYTWSFTTYSSLSVNMLLHSSWSHLSHTLCSLLSIFESRLDSILHWSHTVAPHLTQWWRLNFPSSLLHSWQLSCFLLRRFFLMILISKNSGNLSSLNPPFRSRSPIKTCLHSIFSKISASHLSLVLLVPLSLLPPSALWSFEFSGIGLSY